LRAALTLAWRDGHAGDDSAWRRIKPYPATGAQREVFLTEEQIRSLLKKCDPDFAVLVRAGLYTGARPGELRVVTVGNFDAKTGTLQIPSGKTGARSVVLSDEAVAWFAKLSAKRPKGEPLLLRRDSDNTPWNNMDVSRRMRRAVKAAKLPEETCFYTLRHTYVSSALVRGVNIQLIAENVGTSIRMIEQHYGKFLQADRRKAFNAAPLSLPDEGAALLG
jgi:integrase